MTMHANSTSRLIEEWLQSGNTGTIPEIREALNMQRATYHSVHQALRRLRAKGVAEVVETRVLRYGLQNGVVESPVWAYRTQQAALPVVQHALRTRTALEAVWQAMPRQHDCHVI